ncbi:hypothetical protein ACIGW0_31460 [Streptomyces bikiniensis]|uniref:Uncharacterized protein n=1 Tax=Streptomyces bikiniensis TaxID=1896 RepID=A0ABW8D575_STRBI
MGSHIGRSWVAPGHLEALCPCPLAPCGYVDRDNVDPECTQHPVNRFKTIRSGHAEADCPGHGAALTEAVGKTELAHRAVIKVAAGKVVDFLDMYDALDAYRAAVEHEAAERIREETRHAKTMGVLEPDKFRPCRDAADQIDPEMTE